MIMNGEIICLGLFGTFAGLFFLLRALRNARDAQLIVDNQSLRVPAAVFEGEAGGKNVEFVVSCFGILLGPKIIRFNRDGVWLRSVELGRNSISLSYGTEKKTRSAKLLCPEISEDERREIVEKFRYETGVIPVSDIEREART